MRRAQKYYGTKTIIEKILEKIRIDDECWIWTGQITKVGYPRQRLSVAKKVPTHRYIYDFFYNDLSKNQIVHHTCENKICVNPAHLKAITQSEHGKLLKLSNFNNNYL